MPDLDELLQDYIAQERLRFESTVDGINEVAKVLGYTEQRYAQGSPLEEFLRDNMGAQEALIEWIGQQNLPQWIEALEDELPEKCPECEEPMETKMIECPPGSGALEETTYCPSCYPELDPDPDEDDDDEDDDEEDDGDDLTDTPTETEIGG